MTKRFDRIGKACAHCTRVIGKDDSYYQDIRGVGDLCLTCHAEWWNKKEAFLWLSDRGYGKGKR